MVVEGIREARPIRRMDQFADTLQADRKALSVDAEYFEEFVGTGDLPRSEIVL